MSEIRNFIASRTPPGWETRPFWSLFRRRKLTGYPDEELLSVYRDYGVVPKSSRDDNHNKESNDLSSYQLVDEGSLVINKMKAWQGSIAISRFRGIVSPAYYVYEPLSEEHTQFLHYLMRSEPYIALYRRISRGVRVNQWDLEHEALRSVPVMLPDIDTQKAVAAVLDRETARIDRLVERKRRLTELLAEKRQALVTHAVTGGLDADTRTRSGDRGASEGGGGVSRFVRSDERSRWAACIPDSWGCDRLKWSVDLRTTRPTESERETLPPHISNEDIAPWTGKLLTDDLKATEIDGRTFKKNDVLFNKLRPYLAKVYHAKFDGVSSGELLCLRAKRAVESRFLFYVLVSKCLIDAVNAQSFGATIPRADWGIVGHQPLPLPPLATQRRIAAFLDRETARIDTLRERTLASVDRLGEYRSALITAAVTGQIDVATWGEDGRTGRRTHSNLEGRV